MLLSKDMTIRVVEGETARVGLSLREIADADLVVNGDTGRVIKDRYGSLRTLTPEELREVRAHAS